MKPLDDRVLDDIGPKSIESPFQAVRRKEILDFWNSGVKAAELEVSGKVTLETEREYYQKAIKQVSKQAGIDWLRDVKIHVSQGRVIAERVKKPDAIDLSHVSYDEEQLGRTK